MFWKTAGRLLIIPIAFVLAALAAGFVLVTLGLEHLTHALRGSEPSPETIDASLELLWRGAAIVTGLSIVPALAIIIIGEVARIRSWLYYVIGGGAALASAPLLAGMAQTGSLALPPGSVWQVLATAGFAGGFVYWLIAGRNA